MKKTVSSIFLTCIFLFTLSQPNGFAEDSTRWRLPEGAKARLGKGSIKQIVYSPNGMYLAAAGSAGIWIYDVTIHREVALLTGNMGPISSVAFSPDGNTIISGNQDGTVWVWNTRTGAHIQTFTTADWVLSVAFSPDGNTIASGGGHVEGLGPGIQLLDIKTGKHLEAFGGPHATLSVCFSPDGKLLASGDDRNNDTHLWDAQTGELIATFNGNTPFGYPNVNSVAFSPNGKTIASGSSDGTIRLWNTYIAEDELIKYLVGHTKFVNSVVFSPNGNTIISTGAEGVCLWNVDTGEFMDEFRVPSVSATFSPDGNTFASGSVAGIYMWDAHTFKFFKTLMENVGLEDIGSLAARDIGSVGSVDFSPDGNTIVSCGGNDIHLWDPHTHQLLKTLIGHTEPVNSVVFSPDGEIIASASDDRTIRLWNVNTRKPIKTLMGHTDSVNSVVFSSDGETIASAGNDRTVRLWNANTGELLKALPGHVENVNTITFSPDGKTIASGSGRLAYLGGGEDSGTCVGQEIRLWNANTGEPIKTLKGHTSVVNSVVFSPDGNTIASGSGHWMGYEGKASAGEEVRLWNANTGELIKTLTGHEDVVSSVAFSPDGNLIVSGDWYDWDGHLSSGTWSGEIRVWDAHTGEHLKTLTGHTGGVSSVAFSLDGKTLASGRTDGTILLWDFSSPP